MVSCNASGNNKKELATNHTIKQSNPIQSFTLLLELTYNVQSEEFMEFLLSNLGDKSASNVNEHIFSKTQFETLLGI